MKKDFDLFKNKCSVKINYLLKKADKFGFNDTDADSDSFCFLN